MPDTTAWGKPRHASWSAVSDGRAGLGTRSARPALLAITAGQRPGEANRSRDRVGLDSHRQPRRRRFDHHAVADDDANVSRRGPGSVRTDEENEISWLDLSRINPRTPQPLLGCCPRNVYAGRAIRHHRQTRTVEGVGAGAAP